jgi:hypothetical protein
MKNLLIVLAVAVVAVWAYRSFAASTPAVPADPVTGMIGNDLKFKAQAGVTVRMSMLHGAMTRMMVSGAIDPVVGKPVLDDLDRLHAEVEDAKRQLLLLGDTAEQIATWLRTLNWDDFQATEARFRMMVGA